MIDKNTYKDVDFLGVKGLVFVDGKILVYRRDHKTNIHPLRVDLPGGGREKNESPFDTFKREVKEEFGINIEKDDIRYSKKYQSILDPTKESYFFATRPLNIKESDIMFGDEGTEFRLVNLDEFVKMTDGIKRQQDKVNDYLKNVSGDIVEFKI